MPDERISTELRRKVVEQAAGCCEYCHSQAQFAMQSFSVEHIVPRARGGTNTLDNLALACQGCNNHKYLKAEDRDPITGTVSYTHLTLPTSDVYKRQPLLSVSRQ